MSKFSGKTFICVSLTRFCPVGCKFCFFKSGPVFRKATREDVLTSEGMHKFINFANNVNLGYLLVSGGGEPMMEKKSVLKIIEWVKSERIVLVTSAHWAKNIDAADNYLRLIEDALSKMSTDTSVTVRVSVDSEHAISLGLVPIVNLIYLFRKHYAAVLQLNLQIHSLENDPTIDKLVEKLQDTYKIERRRIETQRISDGKSVIKIVPGQEIIKFDDLEVKIGYAKAFYSDLKVNMTDRKNIIKNINVYQNDLFESEDGNPSIVTNKLGNPGLDFWINYNGNITTWGNQYLDNLFNLYSDCPEDIINGTLKDPAALSFIEKGANYRDGIVSEVNQIAVLRSKAVNIRDYAGALMFDEARTRLYYTIRVLQDYILEQAIDKSALTSLHDEVYELILTDKEYIIDAYKQTSYTIVAQTIHSEFDRDYILDILEWIGLGHYQVSIDDTKRLIDFYNKNVIDTEKIQDIPSGSRSLKMQLVRMTEHLTHIKKEALSAQLLTA